MDIDVLKRRSQQGALISFLGFMMFVIVLGISYYKLVNLKSAVELKQQELQELETRVTVQNKSIEVNEKIISKLVAEINLLTDSTVQIKSRAVEIPGLTDSQGRKIYDFTIWINASQTKMNNIKQVNYKFQHGTFVLKTRQSLDSSNGFLVSYRGWGCLPVVEIEIENNNLKQEKKYYDMCDGLGWK